MSDVDAWAQAANDNDAAVPDGSPEGMNRTGVNNSMREIQAALRRLFDAPEWRDLNVERNKVYTVSKFSDTVVRINSGATDVTANYPTNARVRFGVDGGTIRFGFVASTAYANPNSDITVTVDAAAAVPNGTDLIEVAWMESLGTAAWSDTGTTTGQSPEQVVTIDSLDDAAVVTQLNLATGLDADTVDSKHAAGTASHDSATDLVDLAGAHNTNLLNNAQFAVWQRGTTIDAATFFPNNNNAYGPDCWKLLSGSTSAKVNDVVDLIRSTDTPDGFAYSVELQGETVAGTAERAGLFQPIEYIQSAPALGKNVSLSFWAKVNSGSGIGQIRAVLMSWDGTADAWTADPIQASGWNAPGNDPTTVSNWTIEGAGAAVSPTSSWARYEPLENIAIDTANAKNLGVLIFIDDDSWAGGGSPDSLFLTGVQLEVGANSTYTKLNRIADDVAASQRYFRKTFDEDVTPADNVSGTGALLMVTNGDGPEAAANWSGLPMFQTPTVDVFNPGAGTAAQAELLAGGGDQAVTTVAGRANVGVHMSTGTVNTIYHVHLTADASR